MLSLDHLFIENINPCQMADEIVAHFKRYIDNNSVDSCRDYLAELEMEYEDLPWDYIFQKVY